jgi:hypothetical protein
MKAKTLNDILLDINIRAAIAFGLAMIALLLTYIAFFK